MNPMHYRIEYGADGMPTRLAWSPEIQRAAEERIETEKQKQAEAERQHRKPMEAHVEWAKARGLWP